MGVPTEVKCAACGRCSATVGRPINLLAPSLVPLTAARLTHVVTAADLETLRRQNDAAPRPVTAAQGVAQYAATSCGDAPPPAPLRRVMQAHAVLHATAVRALRGQNAPCECCGLHPRRCGADADRKVSLIAGTGGSSKEYAIPNGTLLPGATGAAVEAAAASGPAAASSSACGGSDWVAAQPHAGGKRPLAVTGAVALVCSHISVYVVGLQTRGEVHTWYLALVYIAFLMGCCSFGLDITCQFLRHMLGQSAVDPAFADAVLQAVMRDTAALLSARIVPQPPGSGASPSTLISVQPTAAAQRVATKARYGAEVAAIDALPSGERAAARLALAAGVRRVDPPLRCDPRSAARRTRTTMSRASARRLLRRPRSQQ
jgi:hypothetical protein